jgi:hypothetical protein
MWKYLPKKVIYNTNIFCSYLERITGIATGSTMFHELAYHHTLFDFKGEYVTDDTVWLSKTHYPSPVYNAKEADFNKVLCCVR